MSQTGDTHTSVVDNVFQLSFTSKKYFFDLWESTPEMGKVYLII